MDFYVCSTPYHLFISLCNIAINKNKSYIYLSTPEENVLKLFEKYEKNLKNMEYIVGVKLRKRDNFKEKFFIEYINDIKEYRQIKEYIKNSKIYIFPWNPYSLYSVSEYIFKKSKNVILIEDGSNSYLKEPPSRANEWIKKYIYFRNIKFYKEDKVQDIRVQFPEKYPQYLKNKLSRLELQNYYNNIDIHQKNKIINVFDSNIDFNLYNRKSIIVLTQPLSEDRYITEYKKKELIKEIVDKYRENYKVIIKKHPRENTKYSIDNTLEIEGYFPSEIFTLVDIEFEKAIGICTSAINSINAKEAFNIDEDFFKKFNRTKLKTQK